MDDVHAHARRVLDVICSGGGVDDPGVFEDITAAVVGSLPEANRLDALATRPMLLTAVDPVDGHPWVVMSVLIHSAVTMQAVVAWELAEIHPDLRPDLTDPIWFTVPQAAIEAHLGVTVVDGPVQYPTWMADLIGDQVVGDRRWGDHLHIELEAGTDPVGALLDVVAARYLARPGPLDPFGPEDGDSFGLILRLVAAAVDANHPAMVDPSTGVAMAAVGLREDRQGRYLVAGLFLIDDHGHTSQVHLTVDLDPWADHPLLTSVNPDEYLRALLGGRTGIVACDVDEFPTWDLEVEADAA